MIRGSTLRRHHRPLVALLVLWVAVSLGVAGGHGHAQAGRPTGEESLATATRAQTPRAPCLACHLHRLTAPPVEGLRALALILPEGRPVIATEGARASSAARPSSSPRAPPLVSHSRA